MVFSALSSHWSPSVVIFSHLSSASFLIEGLTSPEISSACLVHLFGFLSSDLISSLSPPLLLLDKCILRSMCTLGDDSHLDRWVWPLRAQRVTVGWRCWKYFLEEGNKLQSIGEEGKDVKFCFYKNIKQYNGFQH